MQQQSKQIYIFRNTLFPIVKIGMSDNPSKRRTTIENASGFPLELYFESTPILQPRVVESLIHKELGEFRQRGEWFLILPEKAKVIIENIVSLANGGEYKDLTLDFQLEKECTEIIDYKIQGVKHINTSGEVVDRYTEEEEFIYKDCYHNYFIIYKQGILINTVKFCNLGLAKKFKKIHLDRLLKIR